MTVTVTVTVTSVEIEIEIVIGIVFEIEIEIEIVFGIVFGIVTIATTTTTIVMIAKTTTTIATTTVIMTVMMTGRGRKLSEWVRMNAAHSTAPHLPSAVQCVALTKKTMMMTILFDKLLLHDYTSKIISF